MGDTPGDPLVRARKKLFVWADLYGFTREERVELAQYLLRRDITSWKSLDEDQVYRMLDAFEGFHLIGMLMELRSPTEELEPDVDG